MQQYHGSSDNVSTLGIYFGTISSPSSTGSLKTPSDAARRHVIAAPGQQAKYMFHETEAYDIDLESHQLSFDENALNPDWEDYAVWRYDGVGGGDTDRWNILRSCLVRAVQQIPRRLLPLNDTLDNI